MQWVGKQPEGCVASTQKAAFRIGGRREVRLAERELEEQEAPSLDGATSAGPLANAQSPTV